MQLASVCGWRSAGRRRGTRPASTLAAQLVAFARDTLAAQRPLSEAVGVLEHGVQQCAASGAQGDAWLVHAALGQLHVDACRFDVARTCFSAAVEGAPGGGPRAALTLRAVECDASSGGSAAPLGPTSAPRHAEAGPSSAAAEPGAVLQLFSAPGLQLAARLVAAQSAASHSADAAWSSLSCSPSAGARDDEPLVHAAGGLALLAAAGRHLALGDVALCLRCCSDAEALVVHPVGPLLQKDSPSDVGASVAQMWVCGPGMQAELALLRAQAALASWALAPSPAGAASSLDDADTQLGLALKAAEALPGGVAAAQLSPVLAASADVAMARLAAAAGDGAWRDASAVFIAEGLYRKALALLDKAPGGSRGTAGGRLAHLLTWRLAQVLRVSPNRVPEAQRLEASVAGGEALPHGVSLPWARQPQARLRGVASARLLTAWWGVAMTTTGV